jgi:hypothetical protein
LTNDPIKTDEAGKSTVLPAIVPAKSFMTAGPTLHYSHTNVLWLWFLTVLVFFAACAFWYTVVIGGAVSIDLSEVLDPSLLHLGHYAVMPISIFEHSWQIVVLGTLMGILAVVPVLNSQLLSFRYSIPLVLAWSFYFNQLYCCGVSSVTVSVAIHLCGTLHGASVDLLGHLGRRQNSRSGEMGVFICALDLCVAQWFGNGRNHFGHRSFYAI